MYADLKERRLRRSPTFRRTAAMSFLRRKRAAEKLLVPDRDNLRIASSVSFGQYGFVHPERPQK
jgi:hypothetical protein